MWLAGERTLSLAVLIPTVGYFGCLALNDRGKYKQSRFLLMSILNGGIFFYSVAFGRDSGLHFLLFPGISLSILIFDFKERRSLIWSTIFPLSLFAILLLSGFKIPGIPAAHVTAPHILFWSVLIISFFIMLGTIFTLYISYEKTIEELRAGQERLIYGSKMTALGEMSSGIAHEINNPLAVIQARAHQMRWLAENNKLDLDTAIMASSQISETVMRIAKIVRALKAISRDGAKDPYEKVPLARLIQETLDLCSERIRERGIKIETGIVPDGLTIECSPVQISQVILNLLNNAYDAIESLEKKWIRVHCQEEGNGVLIRVTDSGAGIPAEIRNQLFTPFFTTKPQGRGTGLGLSISKGMVEMHGGWLKVDETCANTCMLVYLPKAAAST